MLSGTHFYHATIKRIVSVFGTLFNNITIGRHSGNKISNIQRVPISYGPRNKFSSRMNKDLDGEKIAIKIPRMSFEITSIDYDTSTKLNRLNTTLTVAGNSPAKRKKMYQSVPYTLGMQLNILARNQEDALQILEQILPTFSPEYTVTVKDIEGPNSKTDVPFILNGVSFTDDYEGDYTGRRTLIYTLDFTVRVRFAPDTSRQSIIKKVKTEIADFTNVTTSAAQTMSTVYAIQDSPSANIREFVSLLNPADTQTVHLTQKNINLSGLSQLKSVTGVAIVTGDTPDFDRVENEDFSVQYSGLTGTGGTGTGSSFNIAGDGLSGKMNSADIGLAGLHFVVGDNITINSSPFHNTPNNIVLQVSSVDTPAATGQSPNSDSNLYGAITGVTVSSGLNTPNTFISDNYSPTFTRIVSGTTKNSPNDSNTPIGTGATFEIKLDKTGRVLNAAVVTGGIDYETTNTISVDTTTLGETAETFDLLFVPTGGSGEDASINVNLKGEDGSLQNLSISSAGKNYRVNDVLTVAGNLIGANSPAGSAPSNDLKIRVTNINGSPAQEEEGANSPFGVIQNIEFISGDSPHIERVGSQTYNFDSPFRNLILGVTSTESTTFNGRYTKSGSLNGKPKYIMDSPTGGINDTPTNNKLSISWTGTDWSIKNGDIVLATNSNNSPLYVVPDRDAVFGDQNSPLGFTSNWIIQTQKESDSVRVTSTETQDFSTGETTTGNVTLGTGVVLTSNNHVVTLNNLEAIYNEDEILTGDASGTIRTVYKTIVKK
tara:strand:- start:308 stop:2620 length:2313 start_codon:yes stop_codon:yes gene_type:complete